MSIADTDFLDAYAEADANTDTPDTEQETEVEEGADDAVTGENDTTEAPPAKENDEERPVPYKAMKAERDKRQEREKRITELEAELSKIRQPAQQERTPVEPEPEKAFWEDPDAYIANRLSQSERVQQQRFLVVLEDQMRETHADYDEVIKKVTDYAQSNPAALQQILSSPNPAKAGYQLGKKLDELKQMEDPVTYRARIEAEVRAQIAKEADDEAAGSARVANAIPPDLSSARNVGAKNATKEPDPFKELFPRK